MEWILPIETVSEFNRFEHYFKSNARHKKQKIAIAKWWDTEKPVVILPCTIKLIRMSSRKLDVEDNLRGAFKWIKDAIADKIRPGLAPGRADDTKEIKWEYDQEKSKEKQIRIEIY